MLLIYEWMGVFIYLGSFFFLFSSPTLYVLFLGPFLSSSFLFWWSNFWTFVRAFLFSLFWNAVSERPSSVTLFFFFFLPIPLFFFSILGVIIIIIIHAYSLFLWGLLFSLIQTIANYNTDFSSVTQMK